MTFTPQGQNFGGSPTPPAAPGGAKSIGFFLTVAVLALGVVNFLLGFAPFTSFSSSGLGSDVSTTSNFFESGVYALGFLFAGGVLAGVSLLPNQKYAGVVAALTVVGFVSMLFTAFSVGSTEYADISLGWGLIVVLIFGFVQTVIAAAVLLLDIGLLKAPAPRPVAPQAYGHGYPQGQQYYGQSTYQSGQQGQTYRQPYGQAPQAGYNYGLPADSADTSGQQPPAQQYGGYTPPPAPQYPSGQQPPAQYPSVQYPSAQYPPAQSPSPQSPSSQSPTSQPSGFESAAAPESDSGSAPADETRAFDTRNTDENRQ